MLRDIFSSFRKQSWRQHSARLTLHKEVTNYTQAMRNNFTTLGISVIGVATALTWSDLIRTILADIFPNSSTIVTKLYVATFVTLVSITLTYLITRLTKKNS